MTYLLVHSNIVGNTDFILKKSLRVLWTSHVDTMSSHMTDTLGSLSPLSWHSSLPVSCVGSTAYWFCFSCLSLSWCCPFLNGFFGEGISSVTFWGLLSLEIYLFYFLTYWPTIMFSVKNQFWTHCFVFFKLLDMCGKVCYLSDSSFFVWNHFFFLFLKEFILFVLSDLKFCDDVFCCGFILFSSIVPDPLNLKISSFNSSVFSFNYFCNDI